MSSLFNISPLDGRYASKTQELNEVFSEFGLMRCRIHVEIDYFVFILENILNVRVSLDTKKFLIDIGLTFDEFDAERVKEIEKETNHDVKAVEYYLKEKLQDRLVGNYKEYIHFGLTSQDVNSLAYVIQIKHYTEEIFNPFIKKFLDKLYTLADETKDIVLLSRTHGQPATPTKLGKELMVFHSKIEYQLNILNNIEYCSKFGGAVGNMNAHYAAFPDVNWKEKMEQFLLTFKIKRHEYTTQIDNYDMYAVVFDALRRIQTVMVDFSQDIWLYISMDYFKLKKVDGEIGSSTMPHKVNPIDFENAEGNLLLSNTLLQFFSNKLPISRLQRDLTDSTVLRNLGVAFGHGLIAIKSLTHGTNKLIVNTEKIYMDLNDNWCVALEGIQTVLRRTGFPNPYETVKSFLKDCNNPTKGDIHDFIDSLNIDGRIKKDLKEITPFNY